MNSKESSDDLKKESEEVNNEFIESITTNSVVPAHMVQNITGNSIILLQHFGQGNITSS